ncbi:four helix bundle protein [Rhodohalobacter sp. WB101]|uniref:Four helix bundle protein n=1 Tax=Rhodohalobacter sulfatireducens TaxID=2911366 RepID=A0ABS9KEV7_9BACT|nr:four helix bundle protein [Rhodohalobacter sulfatireducens]MCG2589350.1 four helix bundle protein [Rhodohalobacter sulfatireducens]MDR9366630.1 four helix bundle protein [Balneolaceae bacterium]MDR9409099.1 four helix bundle protein [Balneolaceae bacterium]
MDISKSNFENLEVYQLSETLADTIWDIIVVWNYFAKDTVGKQLVRAADSIGANIAEGNGRGTFKGNKRFVKIARSSLYETKFWLKRASKRNLISKKELHVIAPMINELAPRLNAYLNSIGN